MKSKKTKVLCALLLISLLLFAYCILFQSRQVDIIAVHEDGEFSSVLVKNFPITDKGKIEWWIKNSQKLKEKYKIPNPANDGFFSIVFWDFGDGYKEEGKYDRRCFPDMKPPKNCIEKDRIFSVSDSKIWGSLLPRMMKYIV